MSRGYFYHQKVVSKHNFKNVLQTALLVFGKTTEQITGTGITTGTGTGTGIFRRSTTGTGTGTGIFFQLPQHYTQINAILLKLHSLARSVFLNLQLLFLFQKTHFRAKIRPSKCLLTLNESSRFPKTDIFFQFKFKIFLLSFYMFMHVSWVNLNRKTRVTFFSL